jgi:hypothetical protein
MGILCRNHTLNEHAVRLTSNKSTAANRYILQLLLPITAESNASFIAAANSSMAFGILRIESAQQTRRQIVC